MSTNQPNKSEYNANRKELNLTRRDLKTVPEDVINQFGDDTEYLDLSDNRLKSLDCLYAFSNLKYLILDCNRLHEAHLRPLRQPIDRIRVLTLNKNEFSDLNETVTLISRTFPNLEYLSLHGNPICPDGLDLQPFSQYVSYEYTHYRSHIVHALKKLKFLDHSSVHQPFVGAVPQRNVRVLTFTPKMLWAKLKAIMPDSVYRPLPTQSPTQAGYHSGAIRQVSHDEVIYNGRDSEGNRFICNNDL